MKYYGPRIIFHLLPLVPLAFGQYWLALAGALLVLVSYIKAKKLEAQILEMEARGADAEDLAPLRRVRNFWLRLNFLKPASS